MQGDILETEPKKNEILLFYIYLVESNFIQYFKMFSFMEYSLMV